MAQKSVTLHNAACSPVRPAPPPPSSAASQQIPVILPKPGNSHIKSAPKLSLQPGFLKLGMNKKKAVPPPRPPPPKIQTKAMHQSSSFNDLLLSKQQSAPMSVDLLLDWNSPPTSPTPGRSSSDGISLQSFGSDSSGGIFPPAGTLSRSESGFESEPDLWTDAAPSVQATAVAAAKAFAMPTIIRPNRNKTNAAPAKTNSSALATSNWPELSRIQTIAAPSTTPTKQDLLLVNDVSLPYDYSPPEPNGPPPALPSFHMSTPTRSCREPCAVALYDYRSQHSGDLNFTEGDQIALMRRINAEWMYGRCGSSEGMFPADFVRVVVALDGEENFEQAVCAEPVPKGDARQAFPGYQAVALYAFQAETDGDLSLQEGDVVQVTADLNNGWLVGHHRSGGVGCRQGQFPQSFVQRI